MEVIPIQSSSHRHQIALKPTSRTRRPMTIGTAWSDLRLNFHTYWIIVAAWRFDTRQQNSATRSCSGPYFLSIHCTYLYGDRNYIFGTSCIKRTLNFLCHFSHFFCDAVGGQRANMAFLSRCKMAVSTFSNIPGDHRMTRKINSRWQWIDWACFDGQSDTWSIACLSSLHIDLTGYSQSFLFCLHKAL